MERGEEKGEGGERRREKGERGQEKREKGWESKEKATLLSSPLYYVPCPVLMENSFKRERRTNRKIIFYWRH